MLVFFFFGLEITVMEVQHQFLIFLFSLLLYKAKYTVHIVFMFLKNTFYVELFKKQLLFKSTPYAGGTNNCFLNPPLRWWYK